MSHPIKLISKDIPFTVYLRILTNFIIEQDGYDRADIEQLTKEYETRKIPNSTEKQIMARTRTFLANFYGTPVIDWSLVSIFCKVLRVRRIRLSITLIRDEGEKTYSVETETND